MKKSLIIVAILACMGYVQAQEISIPWQCGFEDDAENQNWQFTDLTPPTPLDTIDAWAIGRGARAQGKQAMYISIDGGQTATFGDRADIVMAYRLIKFPEIDEIKRYDISFDFSMQGAETGTLYVFFDYASTLITDAAGYQLLQYANVGNAAKIPTNVLSHARYVYAAGYSRTQVMRDQRNWRNVSIDAGAGTDYSVGIKAGEQKEYAIVFVWVNKNTNPAAQAKGACIDNIQIADAELQKPQNLSATTECADSSIILTWDGVLSDYFIRYKRSSSTTWRIMSYRGADGQIQHTQRISALRDGTYDFHVMGIRSMWDESINRVVTDTSAQASLSNVLLYCPENQCVNYIDLDAADCSYFNPDTVVHRKVDYGAEDVLSFHTVITDQSLYDMRTNYVVKEVPEGAMASVRLGNWYCPGDNKANPMNVEGININGQAVTYDYTVDTAEAAILMLQYAIVFEQTNHERKDQPYFRLSILDENGNQLQDVCGTQQFDCPFASDEEPEKAIGRIEEEHWKFFPKDDQPARNNDLGFKGDTIWYKDWTSMGLNLSKHHGEKLQIKIESRGCGMSAHYGYGYFTLSCASATLETDQCGTDAEATVEAPEGFKYEWYAEPDSDAFNQGGGVRDKVIKSRDRVFMATKGSDTVYVCHLSYIDAPDCGFDLKTTLSPRGVRPGFSATLEWDTVQWPCSTVVMLRDTSRVIRYQTDGSYKLTADRADYSNWRVRSLTNPNLPIADYSGDRIAHIVDFMGDTIEITQESFINECSQQMVDTVVVPYILTADSVVHDNLCSNRKYVFDHHVFDGRYFPKADTVYSATYRNQYGCDSTLTLYLHLDSATVYEIHDTVSRDMLPLRISFPCGDSTCTYEIGNQYDSVTSDFYVLKLVNRFECDSMINWLLTIVPKLVVEVGETGELCGRDRFELSYNISEGDFDSLRIAYSDAARVAGFRDTVFYHDPYNQPVSAAQEWTMPVEIPANTAPNHYYADMIFYQHPDLFEPQSHRVEIDWKYDTKIIRQKWNDVLILNNQIYDSTYVFTAFQWYEGNIPIDGETKSYLFIKGGLDISGNTTYKALITRDNGVEQFTCDYTPEDRTDKQISDYPVVAQASQRMAIRTTGSARVAIQNMMGVVYSITTLSGGESSITAPAKPGWYVAHIQLEDGEEYSQKILVTE